MLLVGLLWQLDYILGLGRIAYTCVVSMGVACVAIGIEIDEFLNF